MAFSHIDVFKRKKKNLTITLFSQQSILFTNLQMMFDIEIWKVLEFKATLNQNDFHRMKKKKKKKKMEGERENLKIDITLKFSM